jgi:CBS domain-containing protein
MHRQGTFAVSKDRKLLGVLRLEDMKAISREKWRSKTIGDVMRPVESSHFIQTGISLADAREIARTNGIGLVYVIDRNGDLVGVIHGGSRRVS